MQECSKSVDSTRLNCVVILEVQPISSGKEDRSPHQSKMTQALIFRIQHPQKYVRALKKGCRANADILYS
jgi:hypothetical protein